MPPHRGRPWFRDIRTDICLAKRFRLHWPGMLGVIVGSLLTTLLFERLGKPGLAMPTMISLVAIAFTVFIKRGLIGRAWFWGVVGAFAALHVVALVSLSWRDNWTPAAALAGAACLDFFVMLGVIDGLEQAIAFRSDA